MKTKQTAYLINVGYKKDGKILSDAILEETITSVLSGVADNAPTKKDVAFASSVVTELANVPKDLLTSYKADANKKVATLFKDKIASYSELKPSILVN